LAIAMIAVAICTFLLTKMAEVDHGTTELHEKGVMSLNNMALSARIVNFMRITAYQGQRGANDLAKIAGDLKDSVSLFMV